MVTCDLQWLNVGHNDPVETTRAGQGVGQHFKNNLCKWAGMKDLGEGGWELFWGMNVK